MGEKDMQRYIKQVRDEANEDMKLHVGALNELHMEDLKAIKEGSLLTNMRLDRMDSRFDSIDRTLDSHTGMIGTLLEDVSDIKDELKKKMDYSEFHPLVKRVEKLESTR